MKCFNCKKMHGKFLCTCEVILCSEKCILEHTGGYTIEQMKEMEKYEIKREIRKMKLNPNLTAKEREIVEHFIPCYNANLRFFSWECPICHKKIINYHRRITPTDELAITILEIHKTECVRGEDKK